VNGYYKAELVRGPDHPGPWKSVEELELATLGWAHWHNQERLHGFIGDVPPAEFEETFYAEHRQAKALAEKHNSGVSIKPRAVHIVAAKYFPLGRPATFQTWINSLRVSYPYVALLGLV